MISFKLPSCDPLAVSNLKTRSFTYDVALSAIVFKMLGQDEKADRLLSTIETFITAENGIEFSYDANDGPLGMRYVRTGAVSWLGYALVYADRLKHAQILAEFLLTRRVVSQGDSRNGLFRGGFGEIKKETFNDKEIEWISTEHNIDAYFFFRDLGLKLSNTHPQNASRYSAVARDLKDRIVDTLWNPEGRYFYRGLNMQGLDRETPLDVQTWGALFLTATGHGEKARSALQFARKHFLLKNVSVKKELDDEQKFNCQYECKNTSFIGFKPYLASPEYKRPPDLIWTEGSYGYSLAAKRLGIAEPELESSLNQLESCNLYGGVLQTTETRSPIPYEFHAWESTASTSWSLIDSLESSLPEHRKLWTSDKASKLLSSN